MEQLPLPEWIKIAFDARFNEQANIIGKMPEIASLRLRQVELENRLKEELSPQLFQFILGWEETLNYRQTIEKESLYYAGITDGLQIWKHLLNDIAK
ncbi:MULTISPECIES: hypothetical protein [unclassified Paenibacillus]|uniref:hypothetical protein n=1 Tax=unclassified Paenibacillus TaxID=185978 RepID=UPI001C122063|nr:MULTISPECIES: hypothetical protein [unclassified Paenibacillus]MBU5442445.1 hypothetical protein [Paenibacillus sp. MSJ-34]CAH0122648.1 hypothetical protein PAE9249_05220 [Paenibacillus sp. CECT 9249]